MAEDNDLGNVFEALKTLMQPYAEKLIRRTDVPAKLHLDTDYVMKNKKPLFFGAVQIKKNYVSYHLMPVYVNPELLQGMSDELRKRMHGKSCFNFKAIDKDLFAEIGLLTKSGYDFYRSEGYI